MHYLYNIFNILRIKLGLFTFFWVIRTIGWGKRSTGWVQSFMHYLGRSTEWENGWLDCETDDQMGNRSPDFCVPRFLGFLIAKSTCFLLFFSSPLTQNCEKHHLSLLKTPFFIIFLQISSIFLLPFSSKPTKNLHPKHLKIPKSIQNLHYKP